MGNKAVRTQTFFLVLLFVTGTTGFFSVAKAEENFRDLQKRLGSNFHAEKKETEARWDALEESQRTQWAQMKKDVEQKWQTFISSSRKEWVDYDDKKDTRSRLDFENGKIEVEAVLPVDDSLSPEQVKNNIFDQAKKVLTKEFGINELILENQVLDNKGNVVTNDTVDNYLKKDIIPEIKPDKMSYQSKDGQKRLRYSVQINLVPNHIDVRARKFLPIIEKNAQRFNLDPRLIMAVIHTESCFNPLAVSRAGAIGLMQVIPRYAGRESYSFLYENNWVIQPEYLYAPGINVELGSAYLYLLKRKYFSDVQGANKNNYVSICAYNWGPTSIRNKILKRYDVKNMSDSELFLLLRKHTPKETREYLLRVTKRIAIYDAYFS